MSIRSNKIRCHKTLLVSYIEVKGVNAMNRKDEILKIFPRDLRSLLGQVPAEFEEIQEIRLRAGRPLFMVCGGREYAVSGQGRLMEPGQASDPYLVTQAQLRETVEFMGNYSLYAAEEELRQGFITIQGGHRIGVAGRTLADRQGVRLMKFISFINVRVAHQVRGCADGIMGRLYGRPEHGQPAGFLNTLVISPPRCGKTTLLRDMIRQISEGRPGTAGMTVGVVDERSELGACYQGVPQNDLGPRTDVLDCCPKAQGMMMLVRSMSPQVVAVDEIGSVEDVEAIDYIRSCGCSLAATVHGSSLDDMMRKPVLGRLVNEGVFQRYILLEPEPGGGRRIQVLDGAGRPVNGAGEAQRRAGQEVRICG